jgi:hypothetical protein
MIMPKGILIVALAFLNFTLSFAANQSHFYLGHCFWSFYGSNFLEWHCQRLWRLNAGNTLKVKLVKLRNL